MFDRITAAEIASAPVLSGVDNADLPAMITDAYVQVAVARSLIGADAIENSDLFQDLRSIAAAQEAIALNLPGGTLRSSAAFVAASAYQAIDLAYPGEQDSGQTLLEPQGVSPKISALLLFLVADSSADAAEVAASIDVDESLPQAVLLKALKAIGDGDLRSFSANALARPEISALSDASAIAASIGYYRCAVIVVQLLAHLSAEHHAAWELGRFDAIAGDMARQYSIEAPQGDLVVESVIVGPWHLARMLGMAEASIASAATTGIPAPTGVAEGEWANLLQRVAARRPLLWRNHRDAVSAGMLVQGTSVVLAYPTGAGKSTVSELKIAATVLAGRNVVCLVPTLSLLDQFALAIAETLPEIRVTAQRDLDEILRPNVAGDTEVFVMTPESCLAALGADGDRFGDVGLIVFDEAHLMHAEGESSSRRSLDATLCFLSLASRFDGADLMLVSAMIANAQFLADWLAEISGRPAVALDSSWKPTRQARGALLYRRDELQALRADVAQTFESTTNLTPPLALQRRMVANPHGFFGLQSTWESRNTRDYRLLRLLESPVELKVGGHRTANGAWWINPNANSVAARLAAAGARSGLKTLVFTQQVGWSSSLARDVSREVPRSTRLTEDELRLAARVTELLGDPAATYLKIEDGEVVGSAISHHGLLLPDERRLHEHLYQRDDGVPVLVATSTVAQGMNFPSEFVVIAGDKRFDSNVNQRLQLEAHELLNAAGRAGRAGAHSNGLVLVIPGQIVTYDGSTSMDAGWFLLQEAFSKSDQCVDIADPLTSILDRLSGGLPDSEVEYFVRRIGSAQDDEVGPALVRKSLAGFAATRAGRENWIDDRAALLTRIANEIDAEPWAKQVTAVSGLRIEEILPLSEALAAVAAEDHDLLWWRDWYLDHLAEDVGLLDQVLRAGSRAALRGTSEELGELSRVGTRLVEEVRSYLGLWMSGATLSDIQELSVARGIASSNIHLEFARKFVLRVLPDLGYLFGLPALIWRQRASFNLEAPLDEAHPLAILARCVEFGVDSATKLVLLESAMGITRKQAHDLER